MKRHLFLQVPLLAAPLSWQPKPSDTPKKGFRVEAGKAGDELFNCKAGVVRNFINYNPSVKSSMVRKMIKSFLVVLFITMTTYVYSQGATSCLPELKFAGIVNKNMFLGDRWSFMEQGAKNSPVIIALHGAGGNSMAWRFQLSGLSDKFRVIAWNAPGYMLTDEFKTETPGCRDYANALLDFITALKLDSVYLIGNSFGSRVCQCFAINHPEKVIKMALVGPSAFQVNVPDSTKNKIIQGRIDQIKDGGYAFGNKRVDALFGKNASPELIQTVSDNMKATNKRAFLQSTTYFVFAEGYSPTDVASKIKNPVLLIAGEDDIVSPIDKNAAVLKKALTKSELITLKGIGHLPHLEAPTVVNNLIQDFFLKKE